MLTKTIRPYITYGSFPRGACSVQDVVLGKMLAYAEEDPIDEDEADVEGEEADIVATESDEDVDEPQSKVSPDADTVLLFTKPNTQGASQLGDY